MSGLVHQIAILVHIMMIPLLTYQSTKMISWLAGIYRHNFCRSIQRLVFSFVQYTTVFGQNMGVLGCLRWGWNFFAVLESSVIFSDPIFCARPMSVVPYLFFSFQFLLLNFFWCGCDVDVTTCHTIMHKELNMDFFLYHVWRQKKGFAYCAMVFFARLLPVVIFQWLK